MYTGAYQVQGLGSFRGPATVSLSPGTYDLGLEGFTVYEPSTAAGAGFFRFTVDDGGTISAVTNTVRAQPAAPKPPENPGDLDTSRDRG